jgi:hypothetical protein
LLVLALAGGFGALGSLGQAFAGPSIPATGRVPGAPGAARSPRALPVVAPAPTAAARGPVITSGGGGSARVTTHHPASHGIGSTGPGRGSGTGATGPRTPSWPHSGGSGGGAATGGTGGAATSLLNNVAQLGTSITNKIPGPVGGLATQLPQSLANGLNLP